MIEVFRTNVQHTDHAQMLIGEIEYRFPHYHVNFDLTDCDRILRVRSDNPSVDAAGLIRLLNDLGFEAQVLEDESAPSLAIASRQ